MSKPVIMNLEMDNVRYNDTRPQPLITWLQFMNFITVAMLSLIFLKIYNGILLLYEWIFPFKHCQLRHPVILVIGSKNELNQNLLSQMSALFQTKVDYLQDLNDNTLAEVPTYSVRQKTRIIYSQIPINSQEEIRKLAAFVRKAFGDVDVLLVSQNEEPSESGNFLTHLNTHLLTQFWTVMAFLPRMLQKDSGHIVSIALSRTSSLTNTGIMRSVYEEVQQSDSKVKLTLVERNALFGQYLLELPPDMLATLIIRSIWNSRSSSMVTVPSFSYYILMLPILISRFILRPIVKLLNVPSSRHHQVLS